MSLVDGADRLHSPLGDTRHRSVPCRSCRRHTWAYDGVCDVCHEALGEREAS